MEKGEKVKSDTPPHGGSWTYDEKTGEYELVEPPTSMEPKPNLRPKDEETEKRSNQC